MSQSQDLIKLGAKVIVNTDLIKDRIPDELAKILSEEPVGILHDYKLTDGQGIGVVVTLRDGSKKWFFEDEIKTLANETIMSSESNVLLGRESEFSIKPKKSSQEYFSFEERKYWNNDSSISNILNPFNFFEWLIDSLKDVF